MTPINKLIERLRKQGFNPDEHREAIEQAIQEERLAIIDARIDGYGCGVNAWIMDEEDQAEIIKQATWESERFYNATYIP